MRGSLLSCVLLAAAIIASHAVAGDYAGEFTITAYCSCQKCCGRGAMGLTASGKRVRSGMIAADWGVLPQGASVRLSIFPNRTFVVEDTGSAIRGNRIDVWLPSHRAAIEFGVRHGVKVWTVSGVPGLGRRVGRPGLLSTK